jgi:MFS family permease
MLRSRPTAGLLAAGSLLMAWGFGLTAFAGTVGLYGLTVVVWTLGEIVHAPASMSVVADLAPATARGRYQGMYTLAWSGAAFAGPLSGGLVYDHLGRDAVWACCALVGTVAAAGYYALLRVRPAPSAQDVRAPRLAARPASGRAPGRAVPGRGSAEPASRASAHTPGDASGRAAVPEPGQQPVQASERDAGPDAGRAPGEAPRPSSTSC